MLGIRGRDLLIGLSLANLWFIRLWGEVLAVAGPDAYFSTISNADIYALMLNVLLVAAAFVAGATVARRAGPRGRRLMVAGFVLVLFAQFNQLGPELNPGFLSLVDPWKSGKYLDVLAPVVVLLLIVGASVKWPQRALRVAVGFVLLLSPFVAVTFGRAALIPPMRWRPARPASTPACRSATARASCSSCSMRWAVATRSTPGRTRSRCRRSTACVPKPWMHRR